MLGNSHVRFGERDGETCLGDGVKRLVPTPPAAMGFGQGVVNEMLDGLLDTHRPGFGSGLTPDDRDDGDVLLRRGNICTGRISRLDALDLAAVATTVEGHGDGCDPGACKGGKDRCLVGGSQVRARRILFCDLRNDVGHRDGKDDQRIGRGFGIGRLIGHECSPEQRARREKSSAGQGGGLDKGLLFNRDGVCGRVFKTPNCALLTPRWKGSDA